MDLHWPEVVQNIKLRQQSPAVFIKDALQLGLPISHVPILEQPYHHRFRACRAVATLKEVAHPTLTHIFPNREAMGPETFGLEYVSEPRSNTRANNAEIQSQSIVAQLPGRANRLLVEDRIMIVLLRRVSRVKPRLHGITEQASYRRLVKARMQR